MIPTMITKNINKHFENIDKLQSVLGRGSLLEKKNKRQKMDNHKRDRKEGKNGNNEII